jgi:sRNA-binding protein
VAALPAACALRRRRGAGSRLTAIGVQARDRQRSQRPGAARLSFEGLPARRVEAQHAARAGQGDLDRARPRRSPRQRAASARPPSAAAPGSRPRR